MAGNTDITNKIKIFLNIILFLVTILAGHIIHKYDHANSSYLIFLFGSIFIWSIKTNTKKEI